MVNVGSRMGTRWTVVFALALMGGCFASHRIGDPDPDPDPVGVCTFTVDRIGGAPLECEVPITSAATCVDVAMCLCEDVAALPSELRACIASHLEPRGAITLSDFCSGFGGREVPLTDALEGYLGVTETSPECDTLIATDGERPYVTCNLIEQYYCPCVPGPCDADSLVGGSCIDLSFAEAECVLEGLRLAGREGDVCDTDVGALARDCR